MRSIKAIYKKIQREDDVSDIVAFGRAVMGRKFSRDSISRNFYKLVKRSDYNHEDRLPLLRHFYFITESEKVYIPGDRDKIRMCPEYKKWRIEILNRDGFRCSWCMANRTRLEVDHIYPFSALLEEHDIQTVEEARRCGALWNTDNGRVLCKRCHMRTETYGAKAHRFARI